MLNSLHQKYIGTGLAVHSPNGVSDTSKSAGLPITAAMFRPLYTAAIALPSNGNRRLIELSDRQREVVKRAAAGLSNKMIGRELGITEGTVKIHMTAAMKVLGVRHRYELPGVLVTAQSAGRRVRVQLTDRQNEVLGLVADGLRGKEIASRLGIGGGTVKQHMTAILRTVGVSNRAGAVAWWLRNGGRRLAPTAHDAVKMGA
ncbi:LuxR C-terminal-related transcriptional regulator [Azospirillum melinis]|uniref:LuxR C-terminal-related transcriptional regulator n=1 Tax=Azospirillum melinis TaxID=328839 RepID=UPI00375663EE